MLLLIFWLDIAMQFSLVSWFLVEIYVLFAKDAAPKEFWDLEFDRILLMSYPFVLIFT